MIDSEDKTQNVNTEVEQNFIDRVPDVEPPIGFSDADLSEQSAGHKNPDEKSENNKAAGDNDNDGNKSDKIDIKKEKSEKDGAFVSELIAIGIKSMAYCMSLLVLILAVLTVAMPLSAMRTFNKLGMSERALNSGSAYIIHRLEENSANHTDEKGNYAVAGSLPDLTDDDMIEALDVCINLSDSLMRSYSDDDRSELYFARELEKYTRLYMSLNSISQVNAEKSSAALAAVPLETRPYVYNYAHTVMRINYRARVITGETDRMLYNGHTNGQCITELSTSSQTFAGLNFPEEQTMSWLDDYVNFIDLLGVYLSVKQEAIGVTGLLTESDFAPEDKAHNLPAGKFHGKKLIDKDTFSLFVTQENGFSALYNNLKNFSKYAQLAVDYNPKSLDEQLHKLYWIAIFDSVSQLLYKMSMLLNYNSSVFGQSASIVTAEYAAFTCEKYRFVEYNGIPRMLGEIYAEQLANYKAQFAV